MYLLLTSKTKQIGSTLVDAGPRITRQRQATRLRTIIERNPCASITIKPSHVGVACDVLERALESHYAKYPEKRTAVAVAWDEANPNFGNETTAVICVEPVRMGGS